MVSRHQKYSELFGRSLGILCAGILAAAGALFAKPAHVVLVKSALRPEYEQTSKVIIAFLEEKDSVLSTEEILFTNNPGQENGFWNRVIEKRPELIITMGTPATRSAIKVVSGIPVIFTVVLDNLSDFISNSSSSDISGVSLAIPVREQLEMIRKALPEIRRVGFLYSGSSAHMYQDTREIANKMGLRLVASEITSERDIPEVLRRTIPEADVLWMPPDPVIYDRSILRFILLECYKNSIPIMAVSKLLAMAGTPLAMGIDYEDIGRQTAELALKRLAGRSFTKVTIEHPEKVLLYINEGVATSLGLNIPPEILEQAIPVKSWR